MDRDLKILYNYAMGLLMEREAKEHRYFFTQEEFEKNKGKIFIITEAKRKLDEKLEKYEKSCKG